MRPCLGSIVGQHSRLLSQVAASLPFPPALQQSTHFFTGHQYLVLPMSQIWGILKVKSGNCVYHFLQNSCVKCTVSLLRFFPQGLPIFNCFIFLTNSYEFLVYTRLIHVINIYCSRSMRMLRACRCCCRCG